MTGKVWIAAFLIAAFAGFGCGTNGADEHENHQGANVPQKLTITFATNPTPAKTGGETELVATIAQVGKPVQGAKVEFEIWQGEEAHETLEAHAGKDGAYSVKKTFTKPGTYQVTIHTTTKELHQMPTETFEVVE
ncbi:FixH family protein [Tumebacillus algifaecis]|nr:FixH family protein [Tumebacillus algifaecis]